MEQRIEIARKKHQQGYNCAQAVICAYCDEFGLDEQTAYKISEGYGSGMGGLREVCGALSGAFMLAGLSNSNGKLADKSTRAESYAKVKQISAAFANQTSYIKCSDILKHVDANGKRMHPCEECVVTAAKLVEDYLLNDEGVK